ncbi:MAG TPA: hypothetical protein DCL48_07785, partial [Alphaproteobacteria bacterium]|nr:hypothetical protein [Alphaproteobacteria bacterium]
MLKAILTRMIAAGERDLGVPAPFAYFLRDVAPNRLMRFSFIKWVEGTRRVTPADVYHASGLGSAMAEDCGPCMQIHVNLALRDGMAPDLLLALTRRRLDGLPGDIVQAFLFGY